MQLLEKVGRLLLRRSFLLSNIFVSLRNVITLAAGHTQAPLTLYPRRDAVFHCGEAVSAPADQDAS